MSNVFAAPPISYLNPTNNSVVGNITSRSHPRGGLLIIVQDKKTSNPIKANLI